jgi:hypothetical protein
MFTSDSVHDTLGSFLFSCEGEPCSRASFNIGLSADPSYPCMAGHSCVVLPACTNDKCRLEDLGGRWICCQCRRGENQSTWYAHVALRSPDTFATTNLLHLRGRSIGHRLTTPVAPTCAVSVILRHGRVVYAGIGSTLMDYGHSVLLYSGEPSRPFTRLIICGVLKHTDY